MRIKKIHIQNYKSLVDFELDNPKPFCAFVGPNASGKSNIFEALEFASYVVRFGKRAPSFFGGWESIFPYNFLPIEDNVKQKSYQHLKITFENNMSFDFNIKNLNDKTDLEWLNEEDIEESDFYTFTENYSRIFVDKPISIRSDSLSKRLQTDASNLSQIFGQIFQNEAKRQDFIEWLQILIPEFENIEVKQSNIDGSYEFFVYEKSSPNKPFPRNLLSDGTKNILALMAAVYQSNEPQFLCIEEPENGLHPQAIKLLVDFFREKCETEGHHIWLNTHSQTLVRCMEIDEIILVNKIDGRTTAKQASAPQGINIKTDEAWLSNALGGGVL